MAWLWRLELLNVQTAVTTLVAVCSLILVRRQFVLGTRPYLTITSGRRSESQTGLVDSPRNVWWQATLRNVGPGMAVIRASYYRVAFAGASNLIQQVDAMVVREMLKEDASIASERVTLSHLSAGTALAPGQTLVMFEAEADCVAQIARLELCLEYEGILGDIFAREVPLLPSSRTKTA